MTSWGKKIAAALAPAASRAAGVCRCAHCASVARATFLLGPPLSRRWPAIPRRLTGDSPFAFFRHWFLFFPHLLNSPSYSRCVGACGGEKRPRPSRWWKWLLRQFEPPSGLPLPHFSKDRRAWKEKTRAPPFFTRHSTPLKRMLVAERTILVGHALRV